MNNTDYIMRLFNEHNKYESKGRYQKYLCRKREERDVGGNMEEGRSKDKRETVDLFHLFLLDIWVISSQLWTIHVTPKENFSFSKNLEDVIKVSPLHYN